MIWDTLRYFHENENWGDSSKMNGALLMVLDELRHRIDKRFIVHCGFAVDGHSENSQHYKGNAVDFHVHDVEFTDTGNKILNILDSLQVGDKVGFGIYPDWLNKGFHLDLRGTKARWRRINDVYLPIE